MASTHPGVDAYLDGLPDWQRDVCRQLREIIHTADPAVAETIKRTVQPYRAMATVFEVPEPPADL